MSRSSTSRDLLRNRRTPVRAADAATTVGVRARPSIGEPLSSRSGADPSLPISTFFRRLRRIPPAADPVELARLRARGETGRQAHNHLGHCVGFRAFNMSDPKRHSDRGASRDISRASITSCHRLPLPDQSEIMTEKRASSGISRTRSVPGSSTQVTARKFFGRRAGLGAGWPPPRPPSAARRPPQWTRSELRARRWSDAAWAGEGEPRTFAM